MTQNRQVAQIADNCEIGNLPRAVHGGNRAGRPACRHDVQLRRILIGVEYCLAAAVGPDIHHRAGQGISFGAAQRNAANSSKQSFQ